MELAFDSRDLRALCENEETAKSLLGANVAETLKRRLADLRAATSIEDLVVGQATELGSAAAGNMAVGLAGGYRIVFCANHPKPPISEVGGIDWAKVHRIRILGIESSDGDK